LLAGLDQRFISLSYSREDIDYLAAAKTTMHGSKVSSARASHPQQQYPYLSDVPSRYQPSASQQSHPFPYQHQPTTQQYNNSNNNDQQRYNPQPRYIPAARPVADYYKSTAAFPSTSSSSSYSSPNTSTYRQESYPLHRHENDNDGHPQFDEETGQVWKYPNNYSVRDYQLNISGEALFSNTLVALPTGLGKTLIASVVMYNYYRWFPTGIIVFMAPTRPLVTQQMKACHSVVGIPEYDCAHLEGSVTAKVREQAWKEKRVVYCTPQTLMNDLTSGRVDAKKIVCVVVDEAHRATRNYAYTTVVEEISKHSSRFRILALSATPGSDKRQIQEVIEFIWCGGNVYV
jgi:hypothetical protein